MAPLCPDALARRISVLESLKDLLCQLEGTFCPSLPCPPKCAPASPPCGPPGAPPVCPPGMAPGPAPVMMPPIIPQIAPPPPCPRPPPPRLPPNILLRNQTKVICGKRPRSRELRGGFLYVGCHCEKRHGLQDQCPRMQCLGAPECLGKPYPVCGPSMYSQAQHLPMRYKDPGIDEYAIYPAFRRVPTVPPMGPCGGPCGPMTPPCGPCGPCPEIFSGPCPGSCAGPLFPCGPTTPCAPFAPCGPCPVWSSQAPSCPIFPPCVSPNDLSCPLCAPCPAKPMRACCGPCVPPLHLN